MVYLIIKYFSSAIIDMNRFPLHDSIFVCILFIAIAMAKGITKMLQPKLNMSWSSAVYALFLNSD